MFFFASEPSDVRHQNQRQPVLRLLLLRHLFPTEARTPVAREGGHGSGRELRVPQTVLPTHRTLHCPRGDMDAEHF